MGLALRRDELFEPGEYLDQTGPGYFSVLAKQDGRTKQDSYELKHLARIIEGLDPHHDQWISQAVFSKHNRRAENVQSIGLLFADLDTYNRPSIRTATPDEQTRMLVSYCRNEGIPAPSIVMFSGRGLQAKWLLSEALDRVRIPEWNLTQRALVNRLEDFGSDHKARDVSRVLRIDRTVNTKSGEYCRVLYTSSGTADCLARYDFEEMSEILEIESQPEDLTIPKSEPRAPIISADGVFQLKRLAWTRCNDIARLWQIRGGVPEGYRETTLFWRVNFMLLAEPVRTQDLWKEAQAIAANIDPSGGWYKVSDLSTVYRKGLEMQNGKSVWYNGKRYPALYTPTNQTLIDTFEISPDEERYLHTIISYAEKQRRRTEKRRAQGMKEQPYRHHKPWLDMGISRQHYYRLIAQGKAHPPEKATESPERDIPESIVPKCDMLTEGAL